MVFCIQVKSIQSNWVSKQIEKIKLNRRVEKKMPRKKDANPVAFYIINCSI